MRKLKFRAWDSELKAMSKPFSFGHVLNFNDRHIRSLTEKHEIMQFTGLRDKNMEEIYEGDIVNGVEVKWDAQMAMWSLPRREDESLLEYEVTGNIYQNPELLK